MLIGGGGRLPTDMDLSLDGVNPGVHKEGRAILRAADTRVSGDENACVGVGI